MNLRLPRYQAAVAAGELNLLESDSLLVALNAYQQARSNYGRWQDQGRAAFVNGALHDIRRELGTLSVLHRAGGQMPTPARFAPADLSEVIQRRSVYAAIEPIHVARFNYVFILYPDGLRGCEGCVCTAR